MHDYHYVWLIWSVAFFCPWAVLYVAVPEHRAAMWKMSLFMAPRARAFRLEAVSST